MYLNPHARTFFEVTEGDAIVHVKPQAMTGRTRAIQYVKLLKLSQFDVVKAVPSLLALKLSPLLEYWHGDPVLASNNTAST